MIRSKMLRPGWGITPPLFALAMLLGGAPSARADTVLNLTSAPSSGTLNGATFSTNFNNPTGTGVIRSFVRMQASNNTFESGFNTDAQINGQSLTLDDVAGNFTHSIRVGDLQKVNGQYVFFLDANQTNQNGGLPAAGLSLLQLQLFVGTTGTPTPNTFGTLANPLAGQPSQPDSFKLFTGFSSPGTTLVYNMDFGVAPNQQDPGNNMVNINTGLNNGSGSGDLTVTVDASLFGNDPNAFVYLYASYGTPDPNGQISAANGGTYYGNNDGFEEWSALFGPNSIEAVPEPSTMALALSGLVSAGLAGLRRLRRTRAAV